MIRKGMLLLSHEVILQAPLKLTSLFLVGVYQIVK